MITAVQAVGIGTIDTTPLSGSQILASAARRTNLNSAFSGARQMLVLSPTSD